LAWAKRVYDWISRTHANRYGWVADASNSSICESCAIASRIRLGLALYRAGLVDPFGEIDRHVRNQLLENQFVDVTFLNPPRAGLPRTDRTNYTGIDRMVRGTFQCWGTANDLIGYPEIEGCGAGGGVQGITLAWNAQSEWRPLGKGDELRVHLLFNRRIRGPAEGALTKAVPVALELWSELPYRGYLRARAHRPLARLAMRLPDGSGTNSVRVRRGSIEPEQWTPAVLEGSYAVVEQLRPGEQVELQFPLLEYETVEHARSDAFTVRWKGSWVVSLTPPGVQVPLYAKRAALQHVDAPVSAPRYP
jgi:hypothetical protein